MNDIFNSIGNALYNSLCHVDLSLHDKIKDTVVDDFIHELKDYLIKSDVKYRLSKLPKDTLFEINEIEANYVQCYFKYEEFNFPKEMVCTPELENANNGWCKLQLKDDGLYHVVRIPRNDSI